MSAPRIPRVLRWALDRIEPEVILGDLEEEYVEHVLPERGRFRARFWFWKHAILTAIVGNLRSRGPDHPARLAAVRGTGGGATSGTWLTDLRQGVRVLRKSPAVSLVAIITMALGIGVTTHMFGVVYGTVIRGLPFDGAERLMALTQNRTEDGINRMWVPYRDYLDWREAQTTFEAFAAVDQTSINLADPERAPERVEAGVASANLFEMLGVQPYRGRLFRADEEGPAAPKVLILSHALWQSRYGGSDDVLGRTVRVNGIAHTVIGVMPPGFEFPFMARAWTPLYEDPATSPRGFDGFTLLPVGKLRPGVTVDRARAEMNAIAERLAVEYPVTNAGVTVNVHPYTEEYMPAEIVAVLWAMLGAVVGVLLIACFNVTNLLLARGLTRQRELATRAALGASRWQLTRQLTIEAFVLAVIGGVAGLGLSLIGIDLMNAAIRDIQKPYWIAIRMEPTVLVFAIGVTVLATLVAGVAPAIKASRTDVTDMLKDDARGGASLSLSRLSHLLVVGEIAVSASLLVATGFMVKSVMRFNHLDLGFESEQVFTARVGLPASRYADADSRFQFHEELLRGLEGLPGTSAVGLTSDLPVTGAGSRWFGVEGVEYEDDQAYPWANLAIVSPGFFETLQIPILDGRDFTDVDRRDAPIAAVVNRSFAAKYLDNDALGRRFRLGRSDSESPWMTVVGVVPDVHVGGGVGGIGNDDIRPEQIYLALAQTSQRFVSIVARTSAEDPTTLTGPVRDLVAGIDPDLPIYDAGSMDRVIALNTWAFGLFGTLFTIFGAMALFMSAVGLYGVMAFSVGRRRRELGIRMAIGAPRVSIVRLVFQKAAGQLAIGATIGLALGALLSKPLGVVLFEVNTGDLSVYAIIAVTLLVAGVLSCVGPARRATKVELVDALRVE